MADHLLFKLYNVQTLSCFFDVITLNVMKTYLLVYALIGHIKHKGPYRQKLWLIYSLIKLYSI